MTKQNVVEKEYNHSILGGEDPQVSELFKFIETTALTVINFKFSWKRFFKNVLKGDFKKQNAYVSFAYDEVFEGFSFGKVSESAPTNSTLSMQSLLAPSSAKTFVFAKSGAPHLYDAVLGQVEKVKDKLKIVRTYKVIFNDKNPKIIRNAAVDLNVQKLSVTFHGELTKNGIR